MMLCDSNKSLMPPIVSCEVAHWRPGEKMKKRNFCRRRVHGLRSIERRQGFRSGRNAPTWHVVQIDWRLGLIMDLQLMSQIPLIESQASQERRQYQAGTSHKSKSSLAKFESSL